MKLKAYGYSRNSPHLNRGLLRVTASGEFSRWKVPKQAFLNCSKLSCANTRRRKILFYGRNVPRGSLGTWSASTMAQFDS